MPSRSAVGSKRRRSSAAAPSRRRCPMRTPPLKLFGAKRSCGAGGSSRSTANSACARGSMYAPRSRMSKLIGGPRQPRRPRDRSWRSGSVRHRRSPAEQRRTPPSANVQSGPRLPRPWKGNGLRPRPPKSGGHEPRPGSVAKPSPRKSGGSRSCIVAIATWSLRGVLRRVAHAMPAPHQLVPPRRAMRGQRRPLAPGLLLRFRQAPGPARRLCCRLVALRRLLLADQLAA
mmetsp:Transcript_48079/g.140101  ORF Transcript_48079/g.140101 Transcript_48079/m.140101 type:complete len:230 (-) Transcript_48079:131-820(-)